ncbi:xylulokinase [Pseudoxanthomonas indica]|uniref:Xylulose kinase n=1 Tax=Pseudoxanthomonas indica TaxID=428993 RepID=A0A1T5K942_9GAMM|nr:xylulokinase [Pseudoxanthomonas indica]GGD47619.1 xylulokinase [Pseudoxanthomonas indica]SKC60217.1 xylulokinase [Pseudoxanthomonas indica]
MSLFAGIDAGTQSVKVVVYDAAARSVVASTSAPLELISGEDGSREQHPSDWVHAMQACFDRIDPAVRAQVAALAVSGQQHGFVPLDAQGHVLAPAKLWNDTSTTAECAAIMQAVGGAAQTIALAGNPILAGYTASKLPWTRKHRPEVYAKLAKILLPHDYLNFILTGAYFCEYGDASGTGWLDVRTRQWSKELLQATDGERDLSACLPPIAEPDALFDIAPLVAAQLGLATTVKVAVGGGDNMMAAIGTGCVSEGRLAMSLGTSGTLFAYADRPIVDDAGAWAAFCSSTGGWLPLICTMNCTVATEQVAKLFGFSTREGDVYIQATPPGADGLLMLPFLTGERTPDLPLGKGVLAGMDTDNMSPAHFYRAAMEGATYSLKYGYDAFVRAGMRFDRILLTGGGANSAAWRQMVADIFELPVEAPKQSEGAALGAALQALWALGNAQGETTTLRELADRHVTTDPQLAATPDPDRAAAYRASYQHFLQHLQAVTPLYRG